MTKLTLTDFRSYAQARVEVDGRPVVLTGPNGAGKTNLLEALSLLSPGRGLRRAKLAEMGRREAGEAAGAARPWAVAAELDVAGTTCRLGTACTLEAGDGADKRTVKIDGRMARSHGSLAQVAAVQWLTPQMDRLFLEGAAGRRRFVDQVVYGLDADHAGPVNAYDRAMRSRAKLLRDGVRDADWLDSVEDSMARHGIAVAVRRREAVRRLAGHATVDDGPFPDARVAMTGEMEGWLDELPALAAEDRFRERLAAGRGADAETGGAGVGPHRSDLQVFHAATGRPAADCSTGEQKGMLISLVFAAAAMQAEERGFAPLLLLDEIAAHLDESRRAALFGRIAALGAQAWMTGTDADTFAPWGEDAQFLTVSHGTLRYRGHRDA